MLSRLLWLLTTCLAVICGFVIWFVATTPSVDAIKGCVTTKLFQVYLCDDSPNYTRLSEISPFMKHMVLVSEDASFYNHSGFDWDELRNSLELDMSHGRAVRGGSTITQQLAKNVFLTNEKTIIRKVREALLTVQIETLLTKDKIFEKYLNVIELGPEIYGVGPAAKYYFNKSPADLNLLEAAYLTFLIPNPKAYSRSFQKNQLTKYGRYRVLDLCFRLMQTKRISPDQYLAARKAVDLFPWQTLPENLIVALAGGAAPIDFHEPVVEVQPSSRVTPEAEVQPDVNEALPDVNEAKPATTDAKPKALPSHDWPATNDQPEAPAPQTSETPGDSPTSND